ncbi:NlpC/P60 family protein [Rhizobium ruizarguesonis]
MIKYDHLLHKKFKYGKQDCFTLLRNFYIDNFGITLPNYARPKEFWLNGLNLYTDLYRKNGFVTLDCHPSEYQTGDVFLMMINSAVANHVGVLVDSNKILHHLWNRLSIVEPYSGLTRNTTVAVMRHKDVQLAPDHQSVELLDVVSPRVRRKLDEYLRSIERTV